ncbi:hypothetical protein HK104_004609 [Borealophlyctis nickersoniae]|nr:hypothetical protein HK104_004609 [Borealophlyctis nickersoniae]
MPISREARLGTLAVLTTSLFIAEIVVGYISGSIALVADSFHMLSDVISLFIAWYSIKLAGKTSYGPNYTYGWQRAEVLGALINGVFLLALCFTIIVEAVQRFVDVHGLEWFGVAGRKWMSSGQRFGGKASSRNRGERPWSRFGGLGVKLEALTRKMAGFCAENAFKITPKQDLASRIYEAYPI